MRAADYPAAKLLKDGRNVRLNPSKVIQERQPRGMNRQVTVRNWLEMVGEAAQLQYTYAKRGTVDRKGEMTRGESESFRSKTLNLREHRCFLFFSMSEMERDYEREKET